MIGERLREERERLELTQPAFAEAAGAKKRTLIDWEKGVSSPTAVQLSALSEIGADVLYILTGQRTGGTESASPAAVSEKLDNDTRKAIEMAGDELSRQRKIVSGKTLVELVESGRRYIRQARELDRRPAPASPEVRHAKARRKTESL